VANPLTSYLSLPKSQQLMVAIMELPRDNSDSRMDSPPTAIRQHTFGTLAPLSLNPSDFEMREPLSLESEDEIGKHTFTLYTTGSENDFCLNAQLPRASTLQHMRGTPFLARM
jgi:hypothetical protein